MISANELRIGNCLSYLSGDTFIVTHDDIKIIAEWSGNESLLPKPILIAEEPLLKFGFVKMDDPKCILGGLGYIRIPPAVHLPELEVIFADGGVEVLIDGMPVNHIKYIHQMQNLYFSHCGEDMEII